MKMVMFNNCYCKGMVGVLSAYRRAAKRSEAADNYYVLLILTNGTVDDWIDTKKAVIEFYSDLIACLIETKLLMNTHQFVQMRRFLRLAADGSDSIRWSKVALAKEVLAELPSQILEYLDKNHLSPQHLVPRQAEKLSDLTNPDWWRRFTQPLSSQMNSFSEDENDAFQRLQLNDKTNQPSSSSSSPTSPPISSTSEGNNTLLSEIKNYSSMNQSSSSSSPKKSVIPLYRQMSLGSTKLTESYPTKTRFRRLPSGFDSNMNTTNRISSARPNNSSSSSK
ncbi:Copine 9 [Schistosoma japonicum]|nr:Copine 9 [Schistosoma japonicum]